MRPLPRSPRSAPRAAQFRIQPLALALAAALPLSAWGQAAKPALPVAPKTGWLVNGTVRNAVLADPKLPSSLAPAAPTANNRGGQDLLIDQASRQAIYNWLSFDIGAQNGVRFQMPDATSSALNRVSNSTHPSEILGELTSNGRIFLINGNGILFGKDARVNVGGLIASTLNLNNDDFLNGLTTSIYSASPSFFADAATLGAPRARPSPDFGFGCATVGACINTNSMRGCTSSVSFSAERLRCLAGASTCEAAYGCFGASLVGLFLNLCVAQVKSALALGDLLGGGNARLF